MGAGYMPDMFFRFDEKRVQTMFQYMLDMGLSTVRLEVNQEYPELYNMADRTGMMILAGWECCDKWGAWEYNDDINAVKWEDQDYAVAHTSMVHEGQHGSQLIQAY
ncbi:hypothetical protein NUU61_003457 [Penicillium alfredii]|uniref:Uncharacterized protein n=1 Tax=Penicillium alfredii TaxID=1506179 RepID=A0A9W9KCD5_9EURO|nr:uncharacterized protein NUU61_003457 [Penicillium alfredii]KAJ5101235.1 hypothetical protein NUU61_003457 [Penicillium alfredii]